MQQNLLLSIFLTLLGQLFLFFCIDLALNLLCVCVRFNWFIITADCNHKQVRAEKCCVQIFTFYLESVQSVQSQKDFSQMLLQHHTLCSTEKQTLCQIVSIQKWSQHRPRSSVDSCVQFLLGKKKYSFSYMEGEAITKFSSEDYVLIDEMS